MVAVCRMHGERGRNRAARERAPAAQLAWQSYAARRESGAAVAGGPEHAAVARGEEDEDRETVVDGGRQARAVQRTGARERERAARPSPAAQSTRPSHAAKKTRTARP